MKRFITEYANYQKKELKNNSLMQSKFKNEKLSRIDKIINYCKNGFITIDEAMSEISKI